MIEFQDITLQTKFDYKVLLNSVFMSQKFADIQKDVAHVGDKIGDFQTKYEFFCWSMGTKPYIL